MFSIYKHNDFKETISQKSALYYYIQAEHRKAAIFSIITIIKDEFERESAGDIDGQCWLESLDVDWLVETVVQGAFVRAYHDWESSVKEYFSIQANYNKVTSSLNWKNKKSIVYHVIDILNEYSVIMHQDIIDGINAFRLSVNRIKHSEGCSIDLCMTFLDYEIAVGHIIRFWSVLDEIEKFEVD